MIDDDPAAVALVLLFDIGVANTAADPATGAFVLLFDIGAANTTAIPSAVAFVVLLDDGVANAAADPAAAAFPARLAQDTVAVRLPAPASGASPSGVRIPLDVRLPAPEPRKSPSFDPAVRIFASVNNELTPEPTNSAFGIGRMNSTGSANSDALIAMVDRAARLVNDALARKAAVATPTKLPFGDAVIPPVDICTMPPLR